MNTLLESQLPIKLESWHFGDRQLWYEGDVGLLLQPCASIIGTRNITKEGAYRASRVTKILVDNNFCIVSGLAKGIDTLAHKATLMLGGKTIAVMGTPIDDCYPKENLALKERIISEGLVVSQFAPGSVVYPSNFPKRNELMASLSEITIVIEASEKSGTRHQVKSAVKMGKKVGFLSSLANKKYDWILDAIESGHGFIIDKPEDLLQIIKADLSETRKLQLDLNLETIESNIVENIAVQAKEQQSLDALPGNNEQSIIQKIIDDTKDIWDWATKPFKRRKRKTEKK